MWSEWTERRFMYGLMFGTKLKMKPQTDIKILPITESDTELVANFVRKYFFPDEPLSESLQQLPSSNEIPFLKLCKQGLSLKAVNILDKSEDNVAGIVLNKEISEEKVLPEEPSKSAKHGKIRKLFQELEVRSGIWEKTNNEKHFRIGIVAVNDRYRGLKIGETLMGESIKLAKSMGYKYASAECTSLYTIKIGEKLGFAPLYEIEYDKYFDENGEQVFKVKKPHRGVILMLKALL